MSRPQVDRYDELERDFDPYHPRHLQDSTESTSPERQRMLPYGLPAESLVSSRFSEVHSDSPFLSQTGKQPSTGDSISGNVTQSMLQSSDPRVTSGSAPMQPTTLSIGAPSTPSSSDPTGSGSPMVAAQEAGRSLPRRSGSTTPSFMSSPLNPSPSPNPHQSGSGTPQYPFSRPQHPSSRTTSVRLTRIASEESRALSGFFSPHLSNPGGSTRNSRGGSMILYRFTDPALDDVLLPPQLPLQGHGNNRVSTVSESGDSVLSLSSDSKYPHRALGDGVNMAGVERGLVAYAYDPEADEVDPEEDLEWTQDEKGGARMGGRIAHGGHAGFKASSSWRGITNFGMLMILVVALLCLFIVYPVFSFYHGNDRNILIVGNTRINSTGQAI